MQSSLLAVGGLVVALCAAGCDRSVAERPERATSARREPADLVIEQAKALRERGADGEAQALLEVKLGQLGPRQRARAHGLLGRIALAQGQLERARDELTRAIEQSRAVGLEVEATDTAFALVYLEAELVHDLERASGWLDRCARWVKNYPTGQARLHYYRALVSLYGHDLRAALASLRSASAQVARLANKPLARNIKTLKATTLASLGQLEEASRLAFELAHDSEALSACERVDAQGNAGWFALLSLQGRGEGPGQAEARSERAERMVAMTQAFERASEAASTCGDPQRQKNSQLNRGLAALVRGDVEQANVSLAAARAIAGVQNPTLTVWELELEGRARLLERRPAAAHQAFTRELALARATGSGEWVWRALVGLGRAHAAREDWRAAVEAFAEAEADVEKLSLSVPLSEGHGVFLAERDASAQGLVDAQLRLGHVEQAQRAAQRAISRELMLAGDMEHLAELGRRERTQLREALGRYHSLRARLEAAARDDWQLSEAALAQAQATRAADLNALTAALDRAHAALAPQARVASSSSLAPGTLALSYFPLEDGWVGFAVTSEGKKAERIGQVDAGSGQERLAELMLAPFAAQIAVARRIEVTSHRTLAGIDVHALPWAGAPLLAQAPVAYAHSGREPTRAIHAGSALVISDPRENLRAARGEGASVERALLGLPFASVQALVGPRASRTAVLSALPAAAFMHYAGHARVDTRRALDARLELADGSALTAADVLALEAAPERVVLSACDTGRAASGQGRFVLSLAQAFLARGSLQVIAPTREVNDALSAELTRVMYADLAEPLDLVEALRNAQLVLAATQPASDWSSFRVWVP